jgi:streptogramin lyase
MINSAGNVTTLAGVVGSTGSVDGAGSAARFNNPTGIVNGGVGTLWVTDTGNHTVRRINPISNYVSTVAGAAGTSGYADGTGTAAQFATPKGITRDAANNLYVADFLNNSVRKITPAGVVSTVIGRGPNSTCRCEGPLPLPSYQPVSVHISGAYLYLISDDAVLKVNGLP